MDITERQKEIITAGGKIITERGISALTIKNLAAEMGFVESALYRHFRSKEDVIILMIRYLYINVKKNMDTIITSDKSPLDKLKRIAESNFTFLQAHKHFAIVMLAEGLMDESEKIRAEVYKLISYLLSKTLQVISQCIAQNEIKSCLEPEAIMHFYVGGIRLLVFKWKMMRFSTDLVQEGNRLFADFINLISTKNESSYV